MNARLEAMSLVQFKYLDTLTVMVKDFSVGAVNKDWHRLPTGPAPIASVEALALAKSEGWIDEAEAITCKGVDLVKPKPIDVIDANLLPIQHRHQPGRNVGEMNYLHHGFDNERYF